jgi:hypothetical protein
MKNTYKFEVIQAETLVNVPNVELRSLPTSLHDEIIGPNKTKFY